MAKKYDSKGRVNAEGKKLYRGYFNYYKIEATPDKGILKSYNFRDFTKKQIQRLRNLFSNPLTHSLVGERINREV